MIECEVEEEFAFHLEARTEALIAEGLPPADARMQAASEFGDLSGARAYCRTRDRSAERRRRSFEHLTDLWQDVRIAVRTLRRSPLVTIGAVASFALGIGATTTMFSIGHTLMTSLPYGEVDRLFLVGGYDRSRMTRLGDIGLRVAEARALRDESRATAFGAFEDWPVHLGDGKTNAERLQGSRVTSGLFATLGVRPFLGREFVRSDEQVGASPVVVLGYRAWRDRFRADSSLVGRTVRANGVTARVVGIMPTDFSLGGLDAIWTPLSLERGVLATDTAPHLRMIGRLREGFGYDQAAAEVARLGMQAVRERRGDPAREGLHLFPSADWSVQPEGRRAVYAMTALISLVLVIACGNVANLLLARAAARSRETAIRLSLGAPRAALIRASLVEALVLALAGGVAGSVLAQLGTSQFGRNVANGLPTWIRFRVDGTVFGFALGLVLLAALASGIGPGWRASRLDPLGGLRATERGSTGLRQGRVARELALVQVALATALLLLAGLIVQGARRAVGRDPVPSPQQIANLRIELRRTAYPTAASQAAVVGRILERIRGLPQVVSTTASTATPGFTGPPLEFTVGGLPKDPTTPLIAPVSAVTAGFHKSFEIPILEGREFEVADREGTGRVAIVSRDFADRFFPGRTAVGGTIVVGNPGDPSHPGEHPAEPATIVGVAAGIPSIDGSVGDRRLIYLPYSQVGDERVAIAARVEANPAPFLKSMRQVIFEVDPDIPVFGDRVLADDYHDARAPVIFLAALFSSFGLAGLTLASVGVFALVAFGVRERSREIAIRTALGEARGSILKRLSLAMAIRIGVGLGTGATFGTLASPIVGEVLFSTSPSREPGVYVVVLALIGVVGATALLVPAVRAVRVDPMAALRND